MKNTTKLLLLILLIVLVISPLFLGKTVESATSIQYHWEVGIPGFHPTSTGGGFTGFAKILIKWAFRLAGVLAFAMIIFAGFEYTIFSGEAGKQKDALNRIINAIVGLILLFSSWLILNTINPDILKTKEPGLSAVNIPNTSHFVPNSSIHLDTFRETAKSYASETKIKSYTEATNNSQLQNYFAALKQYLGIDAATDPTHGESCDMYVATVMRSSGLDPTYPPTWVPRQYSHLASKTDDFYCFHFNNLSETQPGDILFTEEKSHTAIKLYDGYYQASQGDYFPYGPTTTWYNTGYACRYLHFPGGGGGSSAG